MTGIYLSKGKSIRGYTSINQSINNRVFLERLTALKKSLREDFRSKLNDNYQKGGLASEVYENKFLFCNCDIRERGRSIYDTISLP